MIRPFTLRDLALVYRLHEQTAPLHIETALIEKGHPLRDALINMLVGGHFPTYIWKGDEEGAAGFAQLHLTADKTSAQLLYLGLEGDGRTPTPDQPPLYWLNLMEQLVGEVGRQGIHNLTVQVDENGPELFWLRLAGFAVYTRQDIWLAEAAETTAEPPTPSEPILQARRQVDDWDVQHLYANLVPRLIQLVEPPPALGWGQSWLLREKGELVALAHIIQGRSGDWLRLFVHPNAETAVEQIIADARQLIGRNQQPLYCCVRRYQSWLQRPLEKSGFTHWGSQALMARHTVHHAQAYAPQRAMPRLETQPAAGPTNFSPAHNGNRQKHYDGRFASITEFTPDRHPRRPGQKRPSG
jgi:hypothetical protein